MVDVEFTVSNEGVASRKVSSEGFSFLIVGEPFTVSEDAVASGMVVSEEFLTEVRGS